MGVGGVAKRGSDVHNHQCKQGMALVLWRIMDTNSCPNTGGISHAVLAVGFGREAGKKYWMVRNSWGTRWGEDGHIRLAYNKGVCSITACIAAVIVGSPAANETVV